MPATRLPDGQVGQEKIEYGFGPHLMLDCYGCPKEKLADMDLIFDTLDKFPEKIGMTKIMPPYVFKYHGAVPEDWGISGVVLIAESHITIHTFPDKQHAFIDVFSCKDFDTSFAATYMVNLFDAESHEIQLLSRGLEFPKNMKRATDIVTKERRVIYERPRVYN
jgi:S-adenosylmethionine decarboxylase